MSNSGIANQWLASMRYGYEPANTEVVAAAGRVLLEEIAPEEINASLRARFLPKRTALVMGVPEGEKFAASLEDFKAVLAGLSDLEDEELVAAVDSEIDSLDEVFVLEGMTPGKVIQSSYHEPIDAHHLVLSNNVHVLFKKDPQENAPVRISMRGAGGLTLLDEYDVLSASMIREAVSYTHLTLPTTPYV